MHLHTVVEDPSYHAMHLHILADSLSHNAMHLHRVADGSSHHAIHPPRTADGPSHPEMHLPTHSDWWSSPSCNVSTNTGWCPSHNDLWITEGKKCLFALHTNLKMGTGGRKFLGFFLCVSVFTVQTQYWPTISAMVAGKSTRCAVHSDIVHNIKNWGIVSTIVNIKENKLTAIITFWQLKTASFVINYKIKNKNKSFGAFIHQPQQTLYLFGDHYLPIPLVVLNPWSMLIFSNIQNLMPF